MFSVYKNVSSKNYWSITLPAIIVNVDSTLHLNCIQPEFGNSLWINQKGFQRNQSTTFWQSIELSKENVQNSRDRTIVRRFLQGIHFHTLTKDEANTISIWSPSTNSYCNNDVLQKHKNNVLFARCWHRHYFWRLTNRYTSNINVNNLPKLLTMNVNYTKKYTKQTISCRNNDRCDQSK